MEVHETATLAESRAWDAVATAAPKNKPQAVNDNDFEPAKSHGKHAMSHNRREGSFGLKPYRCGLWS